MKLSNRWTISPLLIVVVIVEAMANVDDAEQVVSFDIRNVAPGYRNTEFVHKVVQITEDAMFVKRVVAEVDEKVVHHFDIFVCNNATPGLFM